MKIMKIIQAISVQRMPLEAAWGAVGIPEQLRWIRGPDNIQVTAQTSVGETVHKYIDTKFNALAAVCLLEETTPTSYSYRLVEPRELLGAVGTIWVERVDEKSCILGWTGQFNPENISQFDWFSEVRESMLASFEHLSSPSA